MADGQKLPLYEGGRRLFENARVVVYADVFEPGALLGPHRHERDYMVVSLDEGHLTVTDVGGGSTVYDLQAGEAVYIDVEPGVHEHTAVHTGPRAHHEITIEFKRQDGAG